MSCRALIFAYAFSATAGWAASTFPDSPGSGAPLVVGELRTILIAARNMSVAGNFAAAGSLINGALAASPNSPDFLDALGALQQDMGEYRLAERSYKNALSRSDSTNALRRGRILNNLTTLYLETGQEAKAETAANELEELPFEEIATSPPDAATILSTLGAMRRAQHDNEAAERLYERSMESWKRAGHAEAMVGHIATSLGNLHFEQRKYEEAEMLYQQAVVQMEASVGPDHPMLIRPLYGLAACECQAGNAAAADSIAQRVAELSRRRLGARHPFTAKAMLLQAYVFRKLGRKHDAAVKEREAQDILRNVSERNLSGYTVDVRELSRKKPRG